MRCLRIGGGVWTAGLVAALGAVVCAMCADRALAAGDGSLTRVKGKAGCLSAIARHGCSRGRALDGAHSVAVSPGGGSVYVASPDADALAVFRRAGRAGLLRQLRGRAGCVSLEGAYGCARARGLRAPSALAVSADGRNLYAGSRPDRAIVAFARNPRTGALRQLSGDAGCVSGRRRSRCRAARGLRFVSSLALGPGGRFLYAGSSAGLAVFRRNARTGELVQLRGGDGCVTTKPVTAAPAAVRSRGWRISQSTAAGTTCTRPPARWRCSNLPAGYRGSCPAPPAASATSARATARPRARSSSPEALAISPAGDPAVRDRHLQRRRRRSSRAPRRPGCSCQPAGPLGCIRDGGGLDCAEARHVDHPSGITLSHDGRNAYVTGTGTLAVLRRDRTTGQLSQLPGKKGCINDYASTAPPYTDCADSRGLNAFGLALSRDGRNAYVTDRERDVIAVYRRAR